MLFDVNIDARSKCVPRSTICDIGGHWVKFGSDRGNAAYLFFFPILECWFTGFTNNIFKFAINSRVDIARHRPLLINTELHL